jgi:hypothetical protein
VIEPIINIIRVKRLNKIALKYQRFEETKGLLGTILSSIKRNNPVNAIINTTTKSF